MTSALLAALVTLVLVLTCILSYIYVGFVVFQNEVGDSNDRSVSFSNFKPSLTSSSSSFSSSTLKEEDLSGPIVTTTTGKVQGLYIDLHGKRIEAYFGIPYATPPTGSFRFGRTQPVIKWRNVFKATQQPPACLQFKSYDIDLPWIGDDVIPESEDCLKLNIWTPSSSSANKTRPTLIWIHGGGFVSGHIRTKEFDGSVLAAQTDSIVAMMNYRVGVFGFLNLDHPEISGNQGMYDQVQAIKWIKSNVASFGGDPELITLMGESAGAASVGYHLISPLTRDLFQRAIMQSGSPLMPTSLVTLDQIYSIANEISSSIGCMSNKTSDGGNELKENESDEQLVKCLKSKSGEEFLAAQSAIVKRKDDSTFCPSFYDDFLPENPIDAMRSPESYGAIKKQILMGFNKDEGSVFMYFSNPRKYPAVTAVTHQQGKQKTSKKSSSRSSRASRPASSAGKSQGDLVQTNVTLNEVISFATKFMKSQNPGTTRNLLNSLYADVNESLPGSVFNATRTNVGEFFVVCPSLFTANDLISNSNHSVYFYHFTHRPKNTPWNQWVGSAHFEEVQFVFGLPLINSSSYTKDEIKLSKRIMRSWTSFARKGIPDISSTTKWPIYSVSNPNVTSQPNEEENSSNCEKYVEISAKSFKIKSKLPQVKCNFWKLTYEVTHSQAEKPNKDSNTSPQSDEEHEEEEEDSSTADDGEAVEDDDEKEKVALNSNERITAKSPPVKKDEKKVQVVKKESEVPKKKVLEKKKDEKERDQEDDEEKEKDGDEAEEEGNDENDEEEAER